MAAPIPKEIQEEVVDQLNQLIGNVHHFGDVPEFEVARARRNLDRLARTSAAAADLNAAGLESMLGDLEEAERRLANASRLGQATAANICRVAVLANHGYFGEACRLVDALAADAALDNIKAVNLAFAAGGFRSLHSWFDFCKVNHRVIAMQSLPYIENAVRISAVMDALGLEEDTLRSALDSAGELMRERRLFWQNTQPDLFYELASSDEGDPLLNIDFRIDVSPEVAADMNDALVEKLAEKALFRPGFSIGFVGTDLRVAS